MVLVFNAQRLRTLGRFTAGDPWNGNRPTEFSIEEYVMMPAGSAQALDTSQFVHRIGLRSETDGSQHMLPESLVELWRRGQVAPERIPALAQAIEPRIVKDDLNLILHQNSTKTIVLPLAAVFAVTVLVGVFVPMEGEHLSIPVAIAMGVGFTALIGAILWVARQSGRSRRAEQMKWMLAVNSGAAANLAAPEGRAKGRVKMFLKIYALFLGLIILIAGGAFFWYQMGGKFPGSSTNEPQVSSSTGDITMPVEVLSSQSAEGVSMLVVIPFTGEQVTVKIPPHASEGQRLRLKGKGAASPAGPRGDLYLKIHIRY